MNLQTSPFSIRDNNVKDLENSSRDNPILDDLISEKNIESQKVEMVHRRRDLDSLG